MYPQQPVPPPYQPPTQTPAPTPYDYLNQIAPQPQKKSFLDSGPKKIIFFGLIAVFLVIFLAIIMNMIGGGQREASEQLAIRLQNTAKVASDAQTTLKSSQLRSVNSTLTTYFSNTNRDMVTPFSNIGIDTAKLEGAVATKEAQQLTELTSTLEDAELNATFDRVYSREMSYRLTTILALMQQLYGSTNSQSLKAYLKSAYDNLLPIQKEFANYDESQN